MDPMKTGRLIAALRRERRLTQRQLAERLHVSDKAVSNGNAAWAARRFLSCRHWPAVWMWILRVCSPVPWTVAKIGREI